MPEYSKNDYFVYRLTDKGFASMLEFSRVEKFMDAFGLSI